MEKKSTGRVIKFRVWDGRKMVYPEDSGVPMMDIRGTLAVYPESAREQHVLMQFAGITDKNAMDVYEGDLLEWLDRKAVVGFKDGEFIAVWDKEATSFNERLRVHSGFSVIGNIYQNPELAA